MALAGLVTGSVAFASLDKSIDLSIDGKTSTVHAFGATVGDVLHSEDIRVGEHDIVSPAPSSAVTDGSDIVVRYGRKLSVTLDGVTRDYWTTARSVDEALGQLGLRADSAKLSVSRSMPLGRTGLSLTMATRKQVTVVDGGKTSEQTTYAATVAALLDQLHVTVGKLDKLSAPTSTPLTDGATLTLTRVVQKHSTGKSAVPFAVKKVKSDSVDTGRTKVKTQGKNGVATVVFLDTYTNGKLSGHQAVSKKVAKAPVTEILLVGTRKPSSSAGSIPSSGGLNWAALARCESGGNPRAVNSNGHYGLYQFSLQTWHSVGGSGNPIDASSAEQTKRAQILYDRAGAGQWSCGAHLYD